MGILERFRTKKPPTKPRGESGRGHFEGFLAYEELNQELVGTRGLRIFDKMYRSDPDVRRAVWMVCNPIVSGTWTVVPYGGEEAEERDVEVAKAVEWALCEFMRPGLKSHLAEALPVGIRSGFAPFESVWGTVEYRGRTLLAPRSLELRLPRTIIKWIAEGYELKEIVQQLPVGGTVSLPAQDLVYYRWGAEGDNWEGTSLLRAAYKPWLIKDKLERLDAIKAERQATGVPVAYPPRDASPEQLEELEGILGRLRTAEQAFVIMPGPHAQDLKDELAAQGWRLDILGHNDSENTDLKPSLEYHSDKIAAAFIAEFMRLGQGTNAVGARATADVQQNPFMDAVEAIASTIEDTLNDSIVRRMVALNWDVEEPPKLQMSAVDSTSLGELADFVSKLVQAKALVADAPLEDFLRSRADLPPADPEERERRQELARRALEEPPAGGQGDPPAPQPKPAPAPQPEPRPKPARDDRPQPTTRAERELRWWERAMELDAIETAIEGARERIEAAGREPALALVREYVRLALAGEAQPAGAPEELVEALERELRALYETGRETVRRELDRQRPLEAETFFFERDEEAERERLERLRRRAQLAATTITGRIWQAIMRIALGRQPTPAAVQAAGEAEAQAALRAEAQLNASGALNEGRTFEAEVHADEIAGARYTSILDSNRCEACAAADDDVLRALDDPVRIERIPPNPACHGGGRCRCMEFFQLKEEAPAPRDAVSAEDAAPKHFDVRGGSPEHRALVVRQLQAIDRVHTMPDELPVVPLMLRELEDGLFGLYSAAYDPLARQVVEPEITISTRALDNEPPIVSVVHEIGHLLDSYGFGAGPPHEALLVGEYLSGTTGMAEWRQAVMASEAYRRLAAEYGPDAYLTAPAELFARSYEQWIALRSGNEELWAKIEARREVDADAYWDELDFEPIAAALDAFFAERGLR